MFKFFFNRTFCSIQTMLFIMMMFVASFVNAKSTGISSLTLENPKTGSTVISIGYGYLDYFPVYLNDFPDGLTIFYGREQYPNGIGTENIEKVVFFVNGQEVRTERLYPYALAGDFQGNVFAYNFTPGRYSVQAVVYEHTHEGSINTYIETMNFEVFDTPTVNTLELINSQTNQSFKTIPAYQGFFADGYQGSSIGSYLRLNDDSPQYFSVAAISDHVTGQTVKSVVFEYTFQGQQHRQVENIEPYALFGDFPKGNYKGVLLQEGSYYIKVTPYTESNGQGDMGRVVDFILTVNDWRTQNTFVSTSNVVSELNIAPNPVVDQSTIDYTSLEAGSINLSLLDLQGNLVKKVYQGEVSADQQMSLQLNREGIRPGTYLLRKESQDGVTFSRIVIK